MSDKEITIVQKSGLGSKGKQEVTYVENQHIIEPTSYTNLTETKNGKITFDPNYLREIIISINTASVDICSKQTDFTIVDIEEKNYLNGLSQEYYDTFIAMEYEPYFNELDDFLSLRENEDLQEKISNIINTLNQKIYTSRKEYDTFEKLLLDIQISLLDSQYEHLHNKVNTIQFVLYYLYAGCFIGLKTKEENNK